MNEVLVYGVLALIVITVLGSLRPPSPPPTVVYVQLEPPRPDGGGCLPLLILVAVVIGVLAGIGG